MGTFFLFLVIAKFSIKLNFICVMPFVTLKNAIACDDTDKNKMPGQGVFFITKRYQENFDIVKT